MGNSIDIQGYLDTVNTPWGKLFYQLVWHHIECQGKTILDFGSGFGITANHFAKNNTVIAIEPNEEMIKYRSRDHDYRQIIGGIKALNVFPDHTFDMVICHNVLEYLENRSELLRVFFRVLKPEGCLSIVKHNRAGKIMQKVVFENNTEEALQLLRKESAHSVNFGTINEYGIDMLKTYCEGLFHVEKLYGVRTFYGLQRNEWKQTDEWLTNMYSLECVTEEIPAFRDIAFFQHVILKVIK